MTLETKRIVIAGARRPVPALARSRPVDGDGAQAEEAGLGRRTYRVPASSQASASTATRRRTRASSPTGKAAPTPRRASAASSATRPSGGRRRLPALRRADRHVVTPRDCSRCHDHGIRGVRPEPPRGGRQHPGLAGQLPGRDGRGRSADRLQPALADAGQGRGQWSTASPAPSPAASSATAPRWRSKHRRRPDHVDDLKPDAETGKPTNLDAVGPDRATTRRPPPC